MDPQQVSQLVEEEKEDVENALRINPPELVNQSPERYPLKKRLQALRLSPENIALLEQVIYHRLFVTEKTCQAKKLLETMSKHQVKTWRRKDPKRS